MSARNKQGSTRAWSKMRRIGALQFEPLPAELMRLPFGDDFRALAINANYAAVLANKSKSELMVIVANLDKQPGEDAKDRSTVETLYRRLTVSAENLRRYADLCEAASTRLLVAGSAAACR